MCLFKICLYALPLAYWLQSYFYCFNMLSVQPPIQIGRQEISMESNSICEREEMPITHRIKQQQRKQFITPAKVVVGVAILCILAIASYELYTIAFPAPSSSKIDQSFTGKITKTPESSSGRGDTSSNTGSQGSKTQKDSNRPIGVATTVGKDTISSNMGTGAGDDGDEEPSENDNDGNRRNRLINKNKSDGSSTEQDSEESVQDQDSEPENAGQVSVWPNNGGSGNLPLVGTTRNLR